MLKIYLILISCPF